MRMRDYWSIVHNWNAHRTHRQCMVAVVHIPTGAPKRSVELSTFLALDFATAAAHGSLEPHRLAIANRKRKPVAA